MFDVWQEKTYIKSSASINEVIIMISVIRNIVEEKRYIIRSANKILLMNVVRTAKYWKL